MAVVPSKRSDMIDFFATRLPVWTQDPAAIGLSVEQVTALGVRITAAQDAATQQQALRAQARAATEQANSQAQSLRSFGGSLVNTIRAFAEASGDPAVFAAAQIPAPAEPTPAPPPSMPFDLRAEIDNTGAVVLTFKADNAAAHTGTYFEVRRRLDGQQGFTLIGATGVKTFTDGAIPQGTTTAVYTVTARRGELSSQASENILVPFASGANGQQAAQTAGAIGARPAGGQAA